MTDDGDGRTGRTDGGRRRRTDAQDTTTKIVGYERRVGALYKNDKIVENSACSRQFGMSIVYTSKQTRMKFIQYAK